MESQPSWWNYEVELSSHVDKRMGDRRFSEIDLRTMLDEAIGFRPAVLPGRFIVMTHHESRPWEVVVEPDDVRDLLVVVTAYRVE